MWIIIHDVTTKCPFWLWVWQILYFYVYRNGVLQHLQNAPHSLSIVQLSFLSSYVSPNFPISLNFVSIIHAVFCLIISHFKTTLPLIHSISGRYMYLILIAWNQLFFCLSQLWNSFCIFQLASSVLVNLKKNVVHKRNSSMQIQTYITTNSLVYCSTVAGSLQKVNLSPYCNGKCITIDFD